MSPKLRVFAATLAGFLALDQATKALVRATLTPYTGEVVVIPGLLSFTHAQNKGAAMSMLQHFEHRLAFFYALAAVATTVLIFTLRHLQRDDRLSAAAIGVLLSGVLGNFVDRLAFGQVTDMIKVQAGFEPVHTWAITTFGTSVYPIFNVADIAIFAGLGLYLLGHLFEKDRDVSVGEQQAPLDLGT